MPRGMKNPLKAPWRWLNWKKFLSMTLRSGSLFPNPLLACKELSLYNFLFMFVPYFYIFTSHLYSVGGVIGNIVGFASQLRLLVDALVFNILEVGSEIG